MTKTFNPTPTAIYLGDNGRALCGQHLGMTARYTGRDISGQSIQRVTVFDCISEGIASAAFTCEQSGCNRTPQTA